MGSEWRGSGKGDSGSTGLSGEHELRVHLLFGVGSDDFLDVTEFPPGDDDGEYVGEGKPSGTFREPGDVLGEAYREWRTKARSVGR